MNPPSKRSVALVIRRGGSRGEWLLVRRPPDDPDLPGVWGLPAGSFRKGETAADLVARIGRDKLGVALTLGARLVEGTAERPSYRLAMRLYEASIAEGDPTVGGGPPDVTQYAAWAWRPPADLAPGAERGSLCCRLGRELASAWS